MPLQNFYKVTLNKVTVPIHADNVGEAIAYARRDLNRPHASLDSVQLWHGGKWILLDPQKVK